MRTQVERLVKKMKYMESGKKWNSPANEKQYIYNAEVRQICVEDYRLSLEEYFRRRKEIPAKIKAVVK